MGEQHGVQQTVVHQTVLHQTIVASGPHPALPTLEPRSERLPGFIPAPEAADIDLVLPPPTDRPLMGQPDEPDTPITAESLAVHRARVQRDAQRRADRRRILIVRWVAVVIVAVLLLVMLLPLIRSMQEMNKGTQGAGRAVLSAVVAVPLVPGHPPT